MQNITHHFLISWMLPSVWASGTKTSQRRLKESKNKNFKKKKKRLQNKFVLMKAKRPGRPEGKLCHPHSQELQRQPQSMLFSIVLCQNNPQNSPGMKQPTLCFSSNPGLELLLTNKTVSFDGSFLQSGLICWRLVSPAPKPLSTGQVPLSVWDLLQPGTTWTRMK